MKFSEAKIIYDYDIRSQGALNNIAAHRFNKNKQTSEQVVLN